MPPQRQFRPQSTWLKSVGYLIFFSRWLQAPLYVGLIIAQLIYVIVFMNELWHLGAEVMSDWSHIDESMIMLGVLGLIDVVMIANLLIMVIIGGYETFVSRIDIAGHPDQPEWLSHVNANVLKVKLAMAIIGISSIHLLKTFIGVNDLGADGAEMALDETTGATYTADGVFWQVVIHMVFIVSALALAWIDDRSQRMEHLHAANELEREAIAAGIHPAVSLSAPAHIPAGASVPEAAAPAPAAAHACSCGHDHGHVDAPRTATDAGELASSLRSEHQL